MTNVKLAFYGGSFDPPHLGHMAIAESLLGQFGLDEFVFMPAFHAPHKKRLEPTPAIDRYAMLCLATQNEPSMSVSKIEIDSPSRPYTFETLGRLNEVLPRAEIYFVMGADSWRDIRTWREWELVLSLANHIVVSRPGYSLDASHVTDEIRSRIIDWRDSPGPPIDVDEDIVPLSDKRIYLTDRVNVDISATNIRRAIRDGEDGWDHDVSREVANYIEKYQIYS